MYDYDYLEAVKEDVVDFIKCDIDLKDFAEREELEEYLNEELFDCDRVQETPTVHVLLAAVKQKKILKIILNF